MKSEKGIQAEGIRAPEHWDVNRCIDLLAQPESAHEVHSQFFYHSGILIFPFVILCHCYFLMFNHTLCCTAYVILLGVALDFFKPHLNTLTKSAPKD